MNLIITNGEILKDITNIKPVRSDAKSLARFASNILSFANRTGVL